MSTIPPRIRSSRRVCAPYLSVEPSWSEDGAILYIGLSDWFPKMAGAAPAAATGGRRGRGGNAAAAPADDAEEQPGVDVWHWKDIEVMAYQSKNASQEGRRNMLAALHVDAGTLTQLGQEVTEQVTPLKRGNLAYVQEWKAYAMERSIGRPFADIYLIDLSTGQRTKIKEKLNEDRYLESSPGGRYLGYLDHDHYYIYDIEKKATVNITKNIKTSFVNLESDATIPQKPPFGVAGWTTNDAEIILYDKFDLWKISPDGAHAARLTNGAADETRYRYVRMDPGCRIDRSFETGLPERFRHLVEEVRLRDAEARRRCSGAPDLGRQEHRSPGQSGRRSGVRIRL